VREFQTPESPHVKVCREEAKILRRYWRCNEIAAPCSLKKNTKETHKEDL